MQPETSTDDLLRAGVVIPAHPLALDHRRKLDEKRQRALSRYYLASGARGLAIGVHTTQFEIHDDPGLLQAVWQLAGEEMAAHIRRTKLPLVRIAGICGDTRQAVREAELARDLGYEFGLVGLRGLSFANEAELISHYRSIGTAIKLFGFYLQPKVGGRRLPATFWRNLCELDELAAIKVAPFDRYATIDVVRAVAESEREDIALYTGNDDNIVFDLITPYRFQVGNKIVTKRFVGGLLGQWAVDTRRSVELLEQCHRIWSTGTITQELLKTAAELTDMNAAIFDAVNDFRGCVAGVSEVLRLQGLLSNSLMIAPNHALSPNQAEEIARVRSAYAHLTDDQFIGAHFLDS